MDDSTTYTVLGRYRLLRRIGRGGMGEVWLAEDPRLRRQVALKVLPTRKRDDQEFLLRFEREARAAAALHHPHILPVHDYGQQQLPGDQTVTYLVMSYVSGGSVEDRLKQLANQQQPLSQDEALAYLSQVAEAIDYAHAHGIIHRDIKPANMLLREDNWLLLTDFGIARILTDTDAATATGAYLGTPTYMAPEQAQGRAQPASDIYSLAIVAYQLFAGRVPFQADNPYAVTFQHAFSAPPSPRLYNPALSPEFETALLRGMAKDPAQRPPSATAYVTSLRQALEMQHALRSTPARVDWQTEPARPTPRLTRRKVLLGAGAGALLIGGGATAYVLSTQAHHGPTLSSTPMAGARASVTVSSGFSAPLTLASVFNSPVTHMAWSPVTNVLVMQGSDSTNQDNGLLTLWTMPAAGQISTPQKVAQQSFFLSIGSGFFPVWSPDGKILALGNGGFDAGQTETLFYTANLSGTVPGIPATAIKAPGGFQGMCWASNEYLVTVESDAGISQAFLKIWNVRHPQQKPITVTLNHQLPLDAIGNFNVLALAPDGSTLGVGTQDGMLLGRLNPASQSSAWRDLRKPLALNNLGIDELAWTRDGRYLAGLDASSNQVGIWDTTQQYKPVQPGLDMSKITGQVTHIAWSPTSRNPLLALGVTQGLVYLWDVRGGAAALRTLPGNLENQIKALCWSFDGHWLAASYNDPAASILFWRM